MDWIVFFGIFLAYISSTISLLENAYTMYNKINVDFPDDPCDESVIPLPDFSAPERRISEVKCLEYVWRIRYEQGKIIKKLNCDFIKYHAFLLLGGREAEYGEYPHMCAIGWKGVSGSWIFKCGGSLISEKFVLTAAHCRQVPTSDKTVADHKPKIVRLGGKSIMDFDPNERNKPAHDAKIKAFISHHRYDPPRQYYDIALIELEEEVAFSWRVHPSCLWTRFENPEIGKLTGWGIVDLYTRKTSPTLQTAEIKIIDYEVCDKILKTKRNRKWQGFKRHQLCAGDVSGNIDTCQGDSGGPLQSLITLKHPHPVLRYNLHHIIGITSFGFGCKQANTPSVYTRVASFIGWIEDIVWKNSTGHNLTNENRFFFRT